MNRIQILIALVGFISIYVLVWLFLRRLFKDKKLTMNILIVIITYSLVGVVAGYSFIIYTVIGEYDRYGERYEHGENAVYFAKDGKKYKSIGEFYDEIKFVNIEDDKDCYPGKESFVTKDGFIVFIASDKVTKTEEIGVYIDENGEEVFEATFVSWGWTGYMYRP